MKRPISVLFGLEAAVALLNLVLLIATLVWKDWIEVVFKVDPDAGSGGLEMSIVVGTAVLTVLCIALARSEWRRLTTTSSHITR